MEQTTSRTITEDTYGALNNLLDGLGYAHVKTDQLFPWPLPHHQPCGLVTGSPPHLWALSQMVP